MQKPAIAAKNIKEFSKSLRDRFAFLRSSLTFFFIGYGVTALRQQVLGS